MKYPIEMPKEKHPRLKKFQEHCDEIVEVVTAYLVIGILLAVLTFGTVALAHFIISTILKI